MSEIVKVTASDIANGERGSACRCPIALAVKRAYPGKTVSVTATNIEVGASQVRTQPDQSQFVNDFDHHKPVTAHSFVLDI